MLLTVLYCRLSLVVYFVVTIPSSSATSLQKQLDSLEHLTEDVFDTSSYQQFHKVYLFSLLVYLRVPFNHFHLSLTVAVC